MSRKRSSQFYYDVDPLRRRRLELGLSYDELGRLSGVNPRTVWRVFSIGSGYPRTIVAIARALGIDPEEIVIPKVAEPRKRLSA